MVNFGLPVGLAISSGYCGLPLRGDEEIRVNADVDC